MSVLEYEIKEKTRPYSNDELKEEREKFYSSLKLSNVVAKHNRSKHMYKVRENGKKYQEIMTTGNSDCGNCSVTWKLRKTPNELKDRAKELIDSYYDIFYDGDPENVSYYELNVEMDFYNWLYNEFNN